MNERSSSQGCGAERLGIWNAGAHLRSQRVPARLLHRRRLNQTRPADLTLMTLLACPPGRPGVRVRDPGLSDPSTFHMRQARMNNAPKLWAAVHLLLLDTHLDASCRCGSYGVCALGLREPANYNLSITSGRRPVC